MLVYTSFTDVSFADLQHFQSNVSHFENVARQQRNVSENVAHQ